MYLADLSGIPDGQPLHHARDIALPHVQTLMRTRHDRVGRDIERLSAIAAEVTLLSVAFLVSVANNVQASAMRANHSASEPFICHERFHVRHGCAGIFEQHHLEFPLFGSRKALNHAQNVADCRHAHCPPCGITG